MKTLKKIALSILAFGALSGVSFADYIKDTGFTVSYYKDKDGTQKILYIREFKTYIHSSGVIFSFFRDVIKADPEKIKELQNSKVEVQSFDYDEATYLYEA